MAIPTGIGAAGRRKESLVIYRVSDNSAVNTMDHATDPAFIRSLHEKAVESADLIFYSSRKLLAEAIRGLEKSHLLEQAVDFEHWSQVSSGTLTVAQKVETIPHPRLGYFGAIEPWLVDQELIKRAAHARPSSD